MEEDKYQLVAHFERKINLLLEKNEGYHRFRGMNPLKEIKEKLSKALSKADIVDLGFLLHLYTLQLRLTMYKNLTLFSMLNFKKDLQEITNVHHAYQRHKNHQTNYSFQKHEILEIKKSIPPLLKMGKDRGLSSDNLELYNKILYILGENVEKIDVDIPKDIIKEMQHIDLKKINNELTWFIKKNKSSTVRELASMFPVFENYKLSLVIVFKEVLFLSNEGNAYLNELDDDIYVGV